MRKTALALALTLVLAGGLLAPSASGAEIAPATDFFVDACGALRRALRRASDRPEPGSAGRRSPTSSPSTPTSPWTGTPRSAPWRPCFASTARSPAPRPGGPRTSPRAWLADHAGAVRMDGAPTSPRSAWRRASSSPATARSTCCSTRCSAGWRAARSAARPWSRWTTRTGSCPCARTSPRPPALVSGAELDEAEALTIVSGHRGAQGGRASGAPTRRSLPGGFGGPHFVRRVAFPMPGAPARIAFEISFARGWTRATGRRSTPITGKVLYRHPLVSHQAAPEGRVFRNYPGAPAGGEHELVSFAGDPDASPFGWSPRAGSPLGRATTRTPPPTGLRPASSSPDGNQFRCGGTFDVPFMDAWVESNCGENPVGLAADAHLRGRHARRDRQPLLPPQRRPRLLVEVRASPARPGPCRP